MSNYTLPRADRVTHLKIVVMSLLAAILFVGIGVAARPTANGGSLAIEGNGVVKASRTLNLSSRETSAIR